MVLQKEPGAVGCTQCGAPMYGIVCPLQKMGEGSHATDVGTTFSRGLGDGK